MNELNKNMRDNENLATKFRDEMDTVVNQMHEELTQRKIQTDQIRVKIKNEQTSSLALQKMLTEVSATFSPKSDVMVGITQKLQTLENDKRKM